MLVSKPSHWLMTFNNKLILSRTCVGQELTPQGVFTQPPAVSSISMRMAVFSNFSLKSYTVTIIFSIAFTRISKVSMREPASFGFVY
jgi:hypothetical protein